MGVHDLFLRRVIYANQDGVASDEFRSDIRIDEPIDDKTFQFRPEA